MRERVARARKRCTYEQCGEFFLKLISYMYLYVFAWICTSAVKRAAALFMTFLIEFILASQNYCQTLSRSPNKFS